MRRRRFLQTATVGTFGLSLPRLLEWEANAARPTGRPKSLIFLFLYGGPSQIDVWDMKPEAPVDFRGEFSPIATTVAGTHICEHLPKMARLAQHYSILRSLYHSNRNHQPAGCWMFSGVNPGSDNAAQLRPRAEDQPALGSLAVKMAPTQNNTVPPFVMMPARLHDQGSNLKGQTGGWLGSAFDPYMVLQDVSAPNFRVDAFEQHHQVSPERIQIRRNLLDALDASPLRHEPGSQSMNLFQQKALDLVGGRRGRSAFDLTQETTETRNRYGRNRFGQGCLLARRLVEAGARVVTVADCSLTGHHEWDTHSGNFNKLKTTLLPRLDQAYSALLQDLLDRSMLDDTVVYLGGEFGRTPRVGQGGFSGAGASRDGRDHYPNVFPAILTGGRFVRGQTFGQSDSKAAYPAKDAVTPEDLFATLFAAMNLDPAGHVPTRENRPMAVTPGKPVAGLLQG